MAPSLEQLKSNYTELCSINERQEKRVRYYESSTIKLVVAYIIFQTFIFLSIFRSNISCQHWFIPFCLSSLTAAIFAIPFRRFVTKWERTKYYYEMHFMELERIHHKMQVMLFRERNQMTNTNISMQHGQDEDEDQSNRRILKPDVVKLYQRNACMYLVTLALVAYTTLVLLSCRSILCHI